MKQKGIRDVLGAAALSVALAGGNVQLATADSRGSDPSELIAPSNSTPFGRSYGRWAAKWWKWVLGVPASKSPLLDNRGKNCDEHQDDDAWFLAGALSADPVIRKCDVPAETPLFFPLINNSYFAFLNDPPETRTEEFVRSIAMCTQPATISLKIDGVSIAQSRIAFTGSSGNQSPIFEVDLPRENIFGLDETVIPELLLSPSAEQGYYVFLYPLRRGRHTIQWTATGCTATGSQNITYHLNVVGGGHH